MTTKLKPEISFQKLKTHTRVNFVKDENSIPFPLHHHKKIDNHSIVKTVSLILEAKNLYIREFLI